MENETTCTTHGKPARWSTCGGFWVCEGYFDDELPCNVDEEEPVYAEWQDIGGEG